MLATIVKGILNVIVVKGLSFIFIRCQIRTEKYL